MAESFSKIKNHRTESQQMPPVRDLERALRDAGCSARRAKTILAEGFKDDLRDEEPPAEPQPEKDRTEELLTRANVALC